MAATPSAAPQDHPLHSAPVLAVAALQALREGGWDIRVWHVDPDSERVLLVDGRDNYGDAFRGHIDRYGDLRGEPCDPGEEPAWLTDGQS